MIGAGDKLQRPARLLVWPAVLVLAVVAWGNFRLLPHWDWSATRLAASIRIAMGFPLYTPPGSAVLTDWIYGPVAPLAYLPAALASTPLGALRIATVLNAVYFLVPLLVLLLPRFRRPEQRLMGAWVAIFGLSAMLLPFGVWYGAAVLHVDTVANALGVLACIALARWRRPWLSAGLWALAAWTKQTVVPLAVAHLIFIGWTEGWAEARRHVLRLAAAGVATTAVFAACFGWMPLWYNLVAVPSRHPVEWSLLGGQLVFALSTTWWIAPVLVAAGIWRRPRPRAPEDGELRLAWLLVLAAVVLLPLGVTSMLKVGGGQNSLHSLTYAILGASALGAALIESDRRWLASTAFVSLLAGVAVILAIKADRVVKYGYLTSALSGEARASAFAFARAHPGQTFFPWDPLVTLMADHRDYPTPPGYRDWVLARVAPSPAELRRHFPETIAFIVCSRDTDPPNQFLAVFPDFDRRQEAGSWWIYTRGLSASKSPAP